MRIYGKVICGALGLLLGGPIGLLIGIWLGHSFDKGLNQDFGQIFEKVDPAQTQQIFFETTLQ